MAEPHKLEFPPLLTVGFHPMTVPDLRALCVTAFPLSTTRDPIMCTLEAMCTAISVSLIRSEIWVDGSFLTKKIEPNDVDAVVVIQHGSHTPEQHAVLERVAQKRFASPHQCDSYVNIEYPRNHAKFSTGEFMRAYWMRQFGFSRGEQIKGIAVIRTPIT